MPKAESATAVRSEARKRPARGPYTKGLQRRQQILDRALTVFDELGFEGTSLRAIADAIGVTHPTLVHYFGSREQLFLEVLREHEQRFIDDELWKHSTLAEFFESGVEHSTKVPGLTALLFGMVGRALESSDSHSRDYFVTRYASLREQMKIVLEAAREAGSVRTDISLDEAAQLTIAAMDGLSTQWLLDRRADFRTGVLLLERLLEPPAS